MTLNIKNNGFGGHLASKRSNRLEYKRPKTNSRNLCDKIPVMETKDALTFTAKIGIMGGFSVIIPNSDWFF